MRISAPSGWYGEIAITTAKDALQRPFRVLTRQGQLTAL